MSLYQPKHRHKGPGPGPGPGQGHELDGSAEATVRRQAQALLQQQQRERAMHERCPHCSSVVSGDGGDCARAASPLVLSISPNAFVRLKPCKFVSLQCDVLWWCPLPGMAWVCLFVLSAPAPAPARAPAHVCAALTSFHLCRCLCLSLSAVRQSLCMGHCEIAPLQHARSLLHADADAALDVQRYKQSLRAYFHSNHQQGVIFVEVGLHSPGAGWHARVDAVPIRSKYMADVPIYVKQVRTC